MLRLLHFYLEDGEPQGQPGAGEFPRPDGAVELANLRFRLHPALVEHGLLYVTNTSIMITSRIRIRFKICKLGVSSMSRSGLKGVREGGEVE